MCYIIEGKPQNAFTVRLFTQDILTDNIAIKIYCDKKTF